VGNAAGCLASYPLGILLARQWIDVAEQNAGLRYARLYALLWGAGRPRVCNLTGRSFPSPLPECDVAHSRLESLFNSARARLQAEGRRSRDIVEDVAVFQRLPAWALSDAPLGRSDVQSYRRLRSGLTALVSLFAAMK